MFHVKHKNIYDVIVVGAGHAGIEAATMSSRLGQKPLLSHLTLTMLEPCHVTLLRVAWERSSDKKIDALGGLIGRASDLSGIQFRVLNRTREAVQGPRAQIGLNTKKHVKPIKKRKISLLFDEVVVNLETKI